LCVCVCVCGLICMIFAHITDADYLI
jgi:hypothetical protein